MPAISAAALLWSSPVCAQAGAALSLTSDERFRGYSVSDGHPAAFLSVSYDLSNGLYAAMSGGLVLSSNDGVQPLKLGLNAGYAERIGSGLTIDSGVSRTSYSTYSGLRSKRSYSDIYVGIAGRQLRSRIHFSPDYFGSGPTVYAEAEADVTSVAGFTLNAHAGSLFPLGRRDLLDPPHRQLDWQFDVAHTFGRMSVRAAWSGGGRDNPYATSKYGNAVTFSLACAL